MSVDRRKKELHLWLVRHGQTTWNAQHKIAGWSDVPLTELGREQASGLQAKLRGHSFEGVWASDLQRAIETARLAYGEPRIDARLRELNFGEFEGMTWEELSDEARSGLLAFDGFAAPGGESLDELAARLTRFVEELEEGRHLIFCHGGVVRALTRDIAEDRFMHNGAVVAVDWVGRLLLYRHDGHVDPVLETQVDAGVE